MSFTSKMKIFITVMTVYAVGSFLLPNGVNSMQGSIMSLTMALVNAKTFHIDNFFINQGGDLAFYNGHYYSGMAPGLSFLLMPHYFILKHLTHDANLLMHLFAVSSTTLCVAVSLTFLYALLTDFGSSEKEASSLTFLCAFGTLFLVYGSALEERTIAASAIIVVFYLIYHNRCDLHRKGAPLSAGIGFLLGVIPSFNYPSMLFEPIFFAYFVYIVFRSDGSPSSKFSCVAFFLIGALIPLCLLAGYHYLAFGKCSYTPYSFRFSAEKELVSEGISGFTYPKIKPLLELLFLPYKGLLFFMPVYVLSFISLFTLAKKSVEFILAGICMVMFVLFNSGFKGWAGESCFGPRLLMESIPFAIILAASVVKKYKKLYYSIFIYSAIVNIAGISARWSRNAESPYIGKILIFVAANGYVDTMKSLVFAFALMIGLFIISLILYEFRVWPLLTELKRETKAKSLGSILKIFILAVALSLICAAVNRWHPMSFARFLMNITCMLAIGSIFKGVIFKKMIQID